MKLRETLRQKIDHQEPVNNYVVNNGDMQGSSAYKTPPYNPNMNQSGVGNKINASELSNQYKALPLNEHYYKVIEWPLLYLSNFFVSFKIL